MYVRVCSIWLAIRTVWVAIKTFGPRLYSVKRRRRNYPPSAFKGRVRNRYAIPEAKASRTIDVL